MVSHGPQAVIDKGSNQNNKQRTEVTENYQPKTFRDVCDTLFLNCFIIVKIARASTNLAQFTTIKQIQMECWC